MCRHMVNCWIDRQDTSKQQPIKAIGSKQSNLTHRCMHARCQGHMSSICRLSASWPSRKFSTATQEFDCVIYELSESFNKLTSVKQFIDYHCQMGVYTILTTFGWIFAFRVFFLILEDLSIVSEMLMFSCIKKLAWNLEFLAKMFK